MKENYMDIFRLLEEGLMREKERADEETVTILDDSSTDTKETVIVEWTRCVIHHLLLLLTFLYCLQFEGFRGHVRRGREAR